MMTEKVTIPYQVWLLAASLFMGVVHCSGDAGKDSADQGASQDCSSIGKSRGVSQSCCMAFGVDACGAGLFCAAFDGRKQPTCYPERSRADMTTCTDDIQCTSGACNPAAKKCMSTPLTTCDPTIGCSDAPTGGRYGCDTQAQPNTCKPVGDGTNGSFCAAHADCKSKVCTDNACACVPECVNRQCGSNGCGGSCGTCSSPKTCSSSGVCMDYCTGICDVLVSQCQFFTPSEVSTCITMCTAASSAEIMCALTAAKSKQCSKIIDCYHP